MAHFYLKTPRKDGSCSVLLAITINSRRLIYNTGILATRSEWDNKNQKMKSKTRSLEVNAKLQHIASVAARYVDELPFDEQPLQGRFSEYMDIQLGKRKETKMTFFAYLEDFSCFPQWGDPN